MAVITIRALGFFGATIGPASSMLQVADPEASAQCSPDPLTSRPSRPYHPANTHSLSAVDQRQDAVPYTAFSTINATLKSFSPYGELKMACLQLKDLLTQEGVGHRHPCNPKKFIKTHIRSTVETPLAGSPSAAPPDSSMLGRETGSGSALQMGSIAELTLAVAAESPL
ncbi:hypothetical protein FVEG_02226 [Fusarium verticillioides 7600]|uniref:Uncharacterized protein n=1 Tax=Gibberella moniliformis (strain M3125 / FGSC 7600) TaxID=334819 RepID=W7LJ28_GIBM7|nr:hypothetical protein FVEG_02226 [Fusarium verticillioides 7600]EWG39383.1 hypothetical protein FVEG_02226 [Fusarium verticillioides 7600]